MNIRSHHPLRESLVSYVRDELPLTQRRKVAKHLASCLLCQRKAHKISVESSQESAGFGYEAAIERAAKGTREWLSRFHEESRPATSFLNTLLESAPGDLTRFRDDPQAHTLKLWQLLQERCRASWLEEPVKSLELAHMAVSVADRLQESRYGTGLVADARAQAWTDLGNSYRIFSDFRNAEQALGNAAEHQRESGDPLTGTQTLMTLAALRKDQGRFDESTVLLDRVIGIYREGEDRHREGYALIAKGTTLGVKAQEGAGDFRDAIRFLRKGISRIESSRNTHLMIASHTNLLRHLTEIGKPLEAWQRLDHLRDIYRNFGKQRHLGHLHWLEGKVAEKLDRIASAQTSLSSARELVLVHGVPSELAFVSLDLSLVLSRQGRRSEAKLLLDNEVIPFFDAVGKDRFAMAARLLYFHVS